MEHIETIANMLSYRRPADSRSELKFIRRFILPVGVESDSYGNLFKRVGNAPILWSCHTDTVHHIPGRQKVKVDTKGIMSLDGKSECLGADNAAGVWLCLEMIKAGVEGLYVFHREEESGGNGSDYIARRTPELVEGCKAAIAFDRRGTRSIITHQWGGRCCSDAFAHSLGDILGMDHVNDPGGSFTDTANYATNLIGECTNVSAGFTAEHSRSESLDLAYLIHLRNRLVSADFSSLEFNREPGDCEPVYKSRWMDHYPLADDWSQEPKQSRDALFGKTLEELVYAYPDIAKKMLESYGVTADDMAEEVG